MRVDAGGRVTIIHASYGEAPITGRVLERVAGRESWFRFGPDDESIGTSFVTDDAITAVVATSTLVPERIAPEQHVDWYRDGDGRWVQTLVVDADSPWGPVGHREVLASAGAANDGLGRFRDDLVALEAAAAYIRRNRHAGK